MRSGTPDVAGAVGMAVAAGLAVDGLQAHCDKLIALRDHLIDRVLATVEDVRLNGPRQARLPGNAHFTFTGCEGDALLMLLDANGIECSTGSACTAGVPQPSHVLLAMGVPEHEARGALRFSFGHSSSAVDVEALAEAIGPVVQRARRAALATGTWR